MRALATQAGRRRIGKASLCPAAGHGSAASVLPAQISHQPSFRSELARPKPCRFLAAATPPKQAPFLHRRIHAERAAADSGLHSHQPYRLDASPACGPLLSTCRTCPTQQTQSPKDLGTNMDFSLNATMALCWAPTMPPFGSPIFTASSHLNPVPGVSQPYCLREYLGPNNHHDIIFPDHRSPNLSSFIGLESFFFFFLKNAIAGGDASCLVISPQLHQFQNIMPGGQKCSEGSMNSALH